MKAETIFGSSKIRNYKCNDLKGLEANGRLFGTLCLFTNIVIIIHTENRHSVVCRIMGRSINIFFK